MDFKKIDLALEKRQKAVAVERDRLDKNIEQMSDLKDVCVRAWDALQDARDALSDLV